jgi:hypothetical protein
MDIHTTLTEAQQNRLIAMFREERERVIDWGDEDDRRLFNGMVYKLLLPGSLCISHPKYLKSHPNWEK